MKHSKLANALRSHAQNCVEEGDDLAADTAELIRVLARIVEGKSIDEAFGAPGDWGYGTPIGSGIYAMLQEPSDDSGVHWHYVDDELPDENTRVMFACSGETDEPGVGYLEGGVWFYDNDDAVDLARFPVYAWAHVPAKPAQKGGAS